MHQYISDYLVDYPSAVVFVMGDFNARLGTIATVFVPPFTLYDTMYPCMDTTTNPRG